MCKNTQWEPRNKEFFECDCHGGEDLIRAEYSDYVIKYPDGTEHCDRDLDITFETRLADYQLTSFDDNYFLKLKDKFVWRIKHAFEILIKGEITTTGYFIPCRSLVDTHKNEVEDLFGYETTKNLAKWLNDKADKIKADYENDIINYNAKKSNNIS